MVKMAIVKHSTLTAIDGTWLDPGHAIRIKERINKRGAEETADEARQEHHSMLSEAKDRMIQARSLRDQAQELIELARIEEEEAEILANESSKSLSRKFGL